MPSSAWVVIKKYQTGWLQQQKFISHSSGGWKSKIKVPMDLVPNENSSWFIDGCLLAVSSHDRERNLLCLFLFL